MWLEERGEAGQKMMNKKQIAIVPPFPLPFPRHTHTHTFLVANYVDCSINSAWGKECEVECVVSNSLISWNKATAELNGRLKWNTGQSGSLAKAI